MPSISPDDSVALLKLEGDVSATLQGAVRLIGGLNTLREPVIIKPNLCTDVDVTGVATTRTVMVDALVQLILQVNSEIPIRIVESDSESKYVDDAFEKLGYRQLIERFQAHGADIALINLSREPIVTVPLGGLYFKNPSVPQVLTRGGYFISLAIPKTHSLTMITGVMKNLFGLLPRKDQSFYHPAINEVVIDLTRMIRPDLCIVDACEGLEGVLSGRCRRINGMIVGRHPLSVDAVLARVMGFDPTTIRHLVEAQPYSLGTLSPNILGDTLESLRVEFRTPSTLRSNAIL